MSSAQSALEYMVIIAAVLGISAVVVMILSSSFNAGANSAAYNACKEAAAQCKVSRYVAINDPCLSCIQACSDPKNGKELFTGAVTCCKQGKPDGIYASAPGCTPELVTLLKDDFTDLTSWTGGLSSSCTNTGGWCINNSGYIGTGLYMDSYGTYSITHNQSTVGYKNIQVSFYAQTCGDDGSYGTTREYLKVEWSDGSTWTTLLDSNRIIPWTLESYTLPVSADGNPNFAVRVTAYDTHTYNIDFSSTCTNTYPNLDNSSIDDFRITGKAI